ncbi:MFS transporter [Streptomyces fuscichromogenes]|uniref:MFS transporter n=1 Tax=Streptomyces fuscichromogenes TaxID=1324013 RepID=UPI00381B49A7
MTRRQSRTAYPESGDARGWTPQLVVSTVAMVMVVELVALSYTMTSTALPSITRHFRTDQGGWLLTCYMLTGAVVSPLLGKLADLHGKRRVLLAGMTVAAAGAAVSALAPTFGVLLAGRCLEGFAISGMFLTYSLMRDVYPPRTLPLAASISVTGIGAFGVGVPFLVGWLLDTFGFRGMYTFDVIVMVILAAVIRLSTPETPRRHRARADYAGAVLLGGGLALVLVAVSQGRPWGWSSGSVAGLFLAGGAALTGFVLLTRRTDEPILNVALFTRRPILLAAVTGATAYGATVVPATILPILALTPASAGRTYGLGMTAFAFAAIASPQAFAQVVGGVTVSRAVRRLAARWCMIAGLSLIAAAGLFLVFFHDTRWTVLTGAVCDGLGTGLAYGSVPNMVIAETPPEEQASIAGSVQVCQSGFASVVPVIMFAVMAGSSTVSEAGVLYAEPGIRGALLLMVALALGGALLALTVLAPGRDRTARDRVSAAAVAPAQGRTK